LVDGQQQLRFPAGADIDEEGSGEAEGEFTEEEFVDGDTDTPVIDFEFPQSLFGLIGTEHISFFAAL
jgi:hypothetical protein